jgi:hypothetical protein
MSICTKIKLNAGWKKLQLFNRLKFPHKFPKITLVEEYAKKLICTYTIITVPSKKQIKECKYHLEIQWLGPQIFTSLITRIHFMTWIALKF